MPNTNRRRVNNLAQALLHFIIEAPTPAQERFLIERLRYRYNIGNENAAQGDRAAAPGGTGCQD